jgi:hypothetical protein
MIIFVVVKRVFQLRVFGALKGCVSVSFGFSGHFVVLVNVVASDSCFWFGDFRGSSSKVIIYQNLLLIIVDIEVSYGINEVFL